LAACGFFALNGGKWPGNPGLAHYFTPDTRIWEPMGLCYSEFVEWAISDRLDQFYEGLRWSGWEAEIGGIGPTRPFPSIRQSGFRARTARRSRSPTGIGDRSKLVRSGLSVTTLPSNSAVWPPASR